MKLKPLVLAATLLALAGPALAQTYDIAVIPKGTTHEFWKAINAGAVKAAREFSTGGATVNIIWKGPLREDDREQQVQVVENFVGRHVSAIVLAPLDAKALVAPAESAMRAGIPVVIIDSGLGSTKPVSTVSTDNYNGGVLGARRLATLLGGKGRVILIRVLAGSFSTEQREAGFLDTIKKEFPAMQVLSSDQHAGATRDSAKQTAENLLNRFGRQLDGVFTPNESSATGMLLALRDAGLVRKVKFVGFDTGTMTVAALKTDEIHGLVVQNPFAMGYLGVKTALAAIRGETVAKEVDTGCAVITKENMTEPAMIDMLHPPLDKYLK